MRKNLFKKVVISQSGQPADWGDYTNSVSSILSLPQEALDKFINYGTPEAQLAYKLWKQSPEELNKYIDSIIGKAEKDSENLINAQSLFITNGLNNYKLEEKSALVFGVSNATFADLVVKLWPKIEDKGATFGQFEWFLMNAISKFSSNTSLIEKFFDDLIKTVGDLEGMVYTGAKETFWLAKDVLENKMSLAEFKKHIAANAAIKAGLTGKVQSEQEQLKRVSTIQKSSELLTRMKTPLIELRPELYNYYMEKGKLKQATDLWYRELAKLYMEGRAENYKEIKQFLIDNKFDWNSIKGFLRYFQNQSKISDIIESFTAPPAENVRENSDSSKLIRLAAPLTSPPGGITPAAGQEANKPENPWEKLVREYQETLSNYENIINKKMDLAFKKQKSQTSVGPFKADIMRTYLENVKDSKQEAKEILELIEQYKKLATDAKEAHVKTINDDKLSVPGLASEKRGYLKNLSIKFINENYKLFIKNQERITFEIDMNSVLLDNHVELTKLQQEYQRIKNNMKSHPMISFVLAPKALAIGFRIAEIFLNIYKDIISKLSNVRFARFREQLELMAEDFKNFYQEAILNAMNEIYPEISKNLGMQAVQSKSPISDYISNPATANSNLRNTRFALEVDSDQKFRDYWNSLFMQSLDPRPMGDIIEEKPKHGNLTTKEDAKLHKKTMSRFKKTRFKKK